MGPATNREKIVRALQRRPRDTDFRSHVFWLVDVIYACKAARDPELQRRAYLLEDALGALGNFLETGDAGKLELTKTSLAAFAAFVHAAPSPAL